MIARKPKAKKNVNVDALIRKGGTLARSRDDAGPEVQVKLTLPQAMLDQVDELVAARRERISRRSWLRAAIAEKIEREM